MDSGGNHANEIRNGNEPSPVVESEEGADEVEGDEETSALLLMEVKEGGMKGRRQRGRRKKVRWNDCNGDDLVQVLEFQPSDLRDSDDEFADSCICTIM